MQNLRAIIPVLSLTLLSFGIVTGQEDYTKYVDPKIENVSQLLVPTYPIFSLPNQMVRMFPIKHDYIADQVTAWPFQVESHRSAGILRMKVTLGEIKDGTGEPLKDLILKPSGSKMSITVNGNTPRKIYSHSRERRI